MAGFAYEARLARCGELMRAQGLDVLLLTKPSNMFYLTGDGRLCAYALVTKEGEVALGVPSTDVADVSALARFDRIAGFEDEVGMLHAIAQHFRDFGLERGTVGLEYAFLPQPRLHMLTHPHAKPEGMEPKDATPVLSQLRLVKEPEEISRLREAARVAGLGMAAAVQAVRRGTTETAIVGAGEYAMRMAGAEDFWRTYVSSGPRTNIAHGLPTRRELESGDLVMIDLHPVVEGYTADICRTVVVGTGSAAQHAAYDLYLRAQQTTVRAARVGADVGELEKMLHGVLSEGGEGSHVFGPPIHGVGIDFEEAPLPPGHAFFHGEKEAAPLARNTVLAVGNCGLYAGPWGVRVEDTMVVGDAGGEILTQFPRTLVP